ncbi:branched-chain amino acid transport system II carrier protein [Enterococcus timonensis]|uniref:branched-chain amino acid transport system II carrier protein n=1 Tax=Enterococcus timonensis TaxID=1852364 RepID=UPI0008DAF09A|nr:branched-chain amino acid transport system II carrier protein [Enterococcus timonensis]
MGKKLSWKMLLVVSSMVFGMFFGSGNLIFPVHLGQMAGTNWLSAGLGFIVSAAVFPLLAILAIVVTRSDGLLDLARPVGKFYAGLFLVLVHLTIGPLFGTPRTAATAFEMAAKPFLPDSVITVGMILFSGLFFGAAYFIATHQHRLLTYVGKYLNVAFLALLAIIFVVALFMPIGPLNSAPSATYETGSLVNGFLEGYNTVDAVALLALSVTFVHAVRHLGLGEKEIAKTTLKAGIIAVVTAALIYFVLIILGATSLAKFDLSSNGGTALSQIVGFYFSRFGTVFLGVLVTLAVFTTAVGLVVSFAQDFHKLFPKVSYLNWLRLTTFISFLVANLGLDQIIAYSLPILMLLYPLSLALILLALTSKWNQRSPLVYKTTIAFTVLPAVMDMLTATPAIISDSTLVAPLIHWYQHYLPLASLGLGWVLPTLVGFLGSLFIFKLQKNPVTLADAVEVSE